MNLCLNARDAMPGGGVLSVRTRLDGDMAVLEVEDAGEGMPAEVLGRIFEPFFSTKEGGTGLGLAVVQQIVETFHGTIRVESEKGRGSRFVIRWPALAG
jgi:signal transduction histidine kinase